MYYGLIDKGHALPIAAAVCEVLGTGGGYALPLLLETSAAETHLGEYRDPTERYAGSGVTQVDKGTFEWLQSKYAGSKVDAKLEKAFGFSIELVDFLELELSPLLAFVFCRLRYMTVKDAIPATVEGRAAYWKKWYNSSAGKGTEAHYLEQAKLVAELL